MRMFCKDEQTFVELGYHRGFEFSEETNGLLRRYGSEMKRRWNLREIDSVRTLQRRKERAPSHRPSQLAGKLRRSLNNEVMVPCGDPTGAILFLRFDFSLPGVSTVVRAPRCYLWR